MKKSKRVKHSRSHAVRYTVRSSSEKDISPIIKFGIVFFWVCVIGLVAYVFKYYTP